MAKIVLWCNDVIGKKMAGPAIRYWEFAKALSKHHEVILLAKNGEQDFEAPFKILKNSLRHLRRVLPSSVALITQDVPPMMAFLAKLQGVRIILDAYDPVVLENLEIFKERSAFQRNYHYDAISTSQLFSFRMADFIICANERQRDLWLGLLMGLRLLTPQTYSSDCTLRFKLDVVPFGLPTTPPCSSGVGLRQKYGLDKKAKVLLWGGGIWNWFDPLTLIEALHLVLAERQDVYLVFMGIKHPNPTVPEMKMAHAALELAKKLDLFDKHVFFNFDWTPYEERQNFLLDADIGVSTHLNHLETAFSFRTRILDYIWAKLPMVSSEGDYFSELIKEKALGEVVPCQNVQALAHAIQNLLQSENSAGIKQRLEVLQKEMFWEKIIAPIEVAVERFLNEKKPTLSFSNLKEILKAFLKMRGPEKVFKKALSLLRS
ncbi:hypothetical protein PHSC3_000839 [Chlamydiales bacterium STE3]|nr:hypothetical protein PHSC3_000839 [Chlamydiales bacterium STE3]